MSSDVPYPGLKFDPPQVRFVSAMDPVRRYCLDTGDRTIWLTREELAELGRRIQATLNVTAEIVCMTEVRFDSGYREEVKRKESER